MGEFVRYRGAASDALAGPLLDAAVAGRVMGRASAVAWLSAGSEVVLLTGPGAVRLPNAVVVAGEHWQAVRPGDTVRVGNGRVAWRGGEVVVGRWWKSRPTLPRVRAVTIREGTARCDPSGVDDRGLGRGLAEGDGPAVVEAASRLLGAGEGLTPLGDDVLAGALAAVVLLGEAAGQLPLAVETALIGAVLAAAPVRTTSLSASLLRCAAGGRVAAPVALLLAALCGRGSIEAARAEVVRIGHSSGAGLLAGVLAGAGAVTGVGP